MGVRYPGRAEIDPFAPQALGICDKCGRQYNLRALTFQYRWAGANMVNSNLLVCDRCHDIPNEQLRAIRLPPDPDPIMNARPENFAEAEKNYLTLLPIIGRATMFDTAAATNFVTVFFGQPGFGGVEIISTLGGARQAVSANAITFVTSATAAAVVTYVAIYDAVTAGNLLAYAQIQLRSVGADDNLSIPAGKLTAVVT